MAARAKGAGGATLVSFVLPAMLRSKEPALAKALERAVPATWNEEAHYVDAEQAQGIGDVLVSAIHKHLASARIAYIYKPRMKRRDRVMLGKAAKASAQIEYFAGFDFVITFNWEVWRELKPEQRVALVDHELSHCGKEGDKWVMVSHDVEEFGSIVRRWGLWLSDVQEFAKVVAEQGELFVTVTPGRPALVPDEVEDDL